MSKLKDHIIDPTDKDYTLCHWFKKYSTRKQFITEPNQNTCKRCLKKWNLLKRVEMFQLVERLVDKYGTEALLDKINKALQ